MSIDLRRFDLGLPLKIYVILPQLLSDSSVNQGKEFQAEFRRRKEKKIKAPF